jgi:multiple sugar transport system substrate-binding protein
MTRSRLLLLLLASLAGLSCGGGDRGEVVFWAFGVEGEYVAQLIPGFERENPGIHVRVQRIPWNAAHEKLLTAFAGRSLPDVAQMGNTWIAEFAVLNAIDDLRPWQRGSSVIRDSCYFPGVWDTYRIDTALLGIPWYVDTRVLFYRSDLLAEAGYPSAPRTWAELEDASARIAERTPGHYGVFFSTNNEWAPPVLFGLQMRAPLLKENDTRGNFSGPEFTAATREFYRFFKNGWAPVKTTQIVNVYQAFAEGYIAMYISGPWYIGEFMRRLPDSLQGSWMTATLPGPDAASSISFAGGSGLVMMRSSGHKAEVWKLMEYLSAPERQIEFYRLTGNLPARLEAWRDSSLSRNLYAGAFYEQLKTAVPLPKVPEWEQIAQEVRQYVELITMDALSVDEGLQALDRKVDGVLEKRRWIAHGE